jgi:hypothetical protein
MPNPVLVKSRFGTRNWFAYVPSDNEGKYWTRYTFSPPHLSYLMYSYIKQIDYGVVRPGINLIRGVTGWSEHAANGTASNWDTDSASGWNYYSTATVNRYILATIPSGYNAILIGFYNVTDAATCAISWDDDSTTGLDVIAYDSGIYNNGASWVSIAANSGADGNKKLKIKQTETGVTLRIIGIRAYNTTATGDPSTAVAGIATGHDIVMNMPQSSANNATGAYQTECALDLTTKNITSVPWAAIEFAIKSNATGVARKFTGSAHYAAGSAQLLYNTGDYTTGPVVFVDGVSVNPLYDTVNNPVGALRTGAMIVISYTGWIDWDEGGSRSSSLYEPDIAVCYTLTPTGLEVSVGIVFNSATDLDSSAEYSVMLPISTARLTGYIRALPSHTKVDLTIDRYVTGNAIELLLDGLDCTIKMSAFGGIIDYYWLAANAKMYARLRPVNAFNGLSPVAGDIWAFGGKWEIRRNYTNVPMEIR